MAHILVIDDDNASRELLTYLLEHAGLEVRGASDGQAGIESMQASTPTLVVCDCQMPRRDGLEVARWMRQAPLLKHIPLVAVTAAAMPTDRDRALAAGFTRYITKPFDPQTIVAIILAEIAAAQAQRDGDDGG